MDNKQITEHLISILNTNNFLTLLQKEALQEVIKKNKPGMTPEEIIELIKLIYAILMMSHST